ncbi:terminase [Rufibacter latericius]|uniref:Terminase n=1 Tax=Rufibacter latericius TaxID=2487040 RepID=A0A3M9MM90_9BACT|nr:terminase [Rufibacter latericius]RNI26646.1 terminase [Rufibacter latericius]
MAAPKENKNAVGNSGGAPSLYRPEYAHQAYKLCLLGATDADLANFFEVAESTINNWKKEEIEFLESIKKGKDLADAEIAESLYHRARGYSHPEDKFFVIEGSVVVEPTTKHYPPDTTAAIFWLKNRKPKTWRDKQEVEHSGELPVIQAEVRILPSEAKIASSEKDVSL